MSSETEEIQVNYFVLCDQVITEAQTNKQSIIGIFSGMVAHQMPLVTNLAVAIGLRIQSARPRGLTFRLTGPEGEALFATPPLPCDWKGMGTAIEANGFAIFQMGLNLQSVPLARLGVYTAALYCNDDLICTYPLTVQYAPQS